MRQSYFLSSVILGVVGVSLSLYAHADGKLGSGMIVSNVEKIINSAGINRQLPRVPSDSLQKASPDDFKAKSTGVTPVAVDVTGLIIRFASEDVKRLSRANQPPPQTLVDEVVRLAGFELIFSRAMSMDSYVFRFASPLSWGEAQLAIERIKKSSNVEAIDADAQSKHLAIPNDPSFNLQWSLQSPNSYPGSANLVAAWDITKGSSGTVIAVVDTGVRPHSDFFTRLLPGYTFITDPFSANNAYAGRGPDGLDTGDSVLADECGKGQPKKDSSWHGTHVAGIMAASANNAVGVAGINWNTRILPVRVLGKCGGTRSDIIDGMTWAAGLNVPGVPNNPNPAKVINMSLGGPSPSGCTSDSSYQLAINKVKAAGALIVVAAGNEDTEAAFSVPAACEGVMTVAAVGTYGYRASYSNYSSKGKVDISAPGGDFNVPGGEIYSTINSGTLGPANSTYGYKSGTSMAAPHVAGIASLALALDPTMGPEFLALSMAFSVRSFPSDSQCTNLYPLCGVGIVDAMNTLIIADALKPYSLVYEFKNTVLNHYFRTSAAAENSNVLNGSAGGGWIDTKDYFIAWKDASSGASPVCRFYSPTFNSHFYTASATECATVKKNPVWSYEGIAYYAKLPSNGNCQSGTLPIYRAYNNQASGNHRFTTVYSNIQDLVAQGWRNEGVAMCGAGG